MLSRCKSAVSLRSGQGVVIILLAPPCFICMRLCHLSCRSQLCLMSG